MIAYDSLVSTSLFNKIKDHVESGIFPWYYVPATAYTGTESEKVETLFNGSFAHTAYDGRPHSDVAETLENYLLSALDLIDVKMNKLIRIRIGMITIAPPLGTAPNPPHVDFDIPHKVALLYLNDSDGDTIIYSEKYNTSSKQSVLEYSEGKDLTVLKRVSPKENRFITFDGLHYHSSSPPVKSKRRIVVNFVYN